jgi:hypothetical protein
VIWGSSADEETQGEAPHHSAGGGVDAEPPSSIGAAGPKAAPVEGPKVGAEVPLPGVDQATIERLKAIIGEWDRRQTEEARRFLEGQAVGAPGAPPAEP